MWTALTRIFGGQSNDQTVVPHDGGGHEELLEVHRPPQREHTEVEARAGATTTATTISRMGEMDDSYDTRQAKQRASVKWLLSKAFNNKVPPNLKEPFYRDHENQEHLKPQILGALSTAELYCLALGNIYSDPNYHNLNHWAILQTLARKGVYVTEPTDAQLTETTLIQTNPLRMTAHMAVIESVMALYAREVVSSDRVLAAVQRFAWNAPTPSPALPPAPANHDDGLILWVNESVKTLLRRIKLEIEETDQGKGGGAVNGGGDTDRLRIPDIPPVQELRDLCDGVALAALISYYCPDELLWQDIRTGARLPSVAGSLHNLGLVQTFCTRCMPASVFHMLPEDVTYMRGSMKQNLVVFLADMFNLLEIHPLQCVRYPGMDKISTEDFPVRNAHGVVHKRNLPPNVMSPIPDLRSGLEELGGTSSFQVPRSAPHSTPMQQLLRKSHVQSSMSEMSEDSLYRPVAVAPNAAAEDTSFVVHRGRNIPTLSSMQQHHDSDSGNGSVTPPVRATRPGSAGSSSNGGGGESRVAGKPSNWEDNKKSSFAGRRSRRNSTSDDSQLTIENFGGSQDNLNFIGRNTDKEVGAHVGRRISVPALPSPPIIQPSPVRSSVQDARGSLQLGYGDEDNDNEPPAPAYRNIQMSQQPAHNGYPQDSQQNSAGGMPRQMSSDDIIGGGYQRQLSAGSGGKSVMRELVEGDMIGGVDGRRIGGVQQVYMQHNSDDPSDQYQPSPSSKSSFLTRSNSASANGGGSEKKTATFATLPTTTTTWQQLQQQVGSGGGGGDGLEQQYMQQHPHGGVMSRSDEGTSGGVNYSVTGGGGGAAQLNDIRLKLEEKRRDIENTKRRYEMDANRQRQKVGKAAFLQAVTNKGKVSESKSPPADCMVDSLMTGVTTTTSAPSSPTNSGAAAPAQPDRPHTAHQDIPDHMERKWMDHNGTYSDRRVADIENMDLEKYQHSISQMNSSLVDMQADIQRLANQHNQMQMAQMAQKQLYQNYHPSQMQQYQSPYSNQYNTQSGTGIYNPLQSSASAPHIPQSLYQQQQHGSSVDQQSSQFFLHSGVGAGGAGQPIPVAVAPVVPQRRTWAQQPPQSHQQPQLADVYPPQQHQPQPEMRTWGSKPHLSSSPGGAGFMLHDNTGDRYTLDNRYTNGNTPDSHTHHPHHTPSTGFSLSKQHLIFSSANLPPSTQSTTNNSVQSTPGASPQHQRQHRQLSQLMAGATTSSGPVSLQQMDGNSAPPQRPERRSSGTTVMHAPIPAPPVDDMEPQDISFIAGVGGSAGMQGEGDGLSDGLSRLNITSGTRTYRIPSPTRPFLSRGSSHYASPPPSTSIESSSDPPSTSANSNATKGFYISFDDEQPPKRPKPPLRTKKMTMVIEGASICGLGSAGSEKKHREQQEDEKEMYGREREYQEKMERRRQLERELNEERAKRDMHGDQRQRELMGQRLRDTTSQERERDRVNAASSIIIGNELSNPDPEVLDELERKKEKILMLSLQRRQQQEEAKEKKEAEACARREREKAKEDERARKKDEQAQRRAVILEQYKLKKAIDEAEREGKDIDKGMLNSLKPTPKMRSKPSTGRPRPKTIHIDSGSVEMAEGMLQPSRGKKGSSSNLTASSAYNPSSMKRDYYRGSQDSLASTGILYKDSPDDSRGISPSSTSAATGHQTLLRRSSYKTSRDPSPAQTRGRSKYSTYQNFKGRKSNSLMNLYGSSTDQDSMVYRYGDTDSGLGRATPPRRAASPGMGPAAMRHLPSPSGPGSLPGGLMTKQRRLFDDGSSDISSNASSMMDYNGPRLYKQPATKSNRGIMLNAVEYCVFPGVVNKEAKSRVLEEISRSESKHYLILFRDAGCQFRALYSYCPDREEIAKLYGTGPKLVNDRMFDKFFKYNSGGKCFSQVHTKHLTVTIDAFTIHNSLWQGKKVNLPNKKDMVLVI